MPHRTKAAADPVESALDNLHQKLTERTIRPAVPFSEFLRELAGNPRAALRNVFQVFHDMIAGSLGSGVDEYPEDPESIHFVNYNCSKLFEAHTDRPFFADRLFANRLVNLVEIMMRGNQQNKIYIFNGPPGCGKSTFLNNLLRKFQDYANSAEGMRYELLWRIDPAALGRSPGDHPGQGDALEKLAALLEKEERGSGASAPLPRIVEPADGAFEIPCPSHDHPILIIPKAYREAFLHDLFGQSPLKKAIFHEKAYHWVFKDKPCTFCSSLYRALLNKLKDPRKVHEMVYARHYRFNRRLGEGITVFNPGDASPGPMAGDSTIQQRLNWLFQNSDVRYVYSRFAKTNNGIYALMDVKSNNADRLIELHNIISEGVHKVDDVEENVKSLLLAIMNPEDQENTKGFKSFSDRIEYINIPYVMDLNTEVKIYRATFGGRIEERFLPRVLPNFARLIISSRLSSRSDALLEWIGDPRKYDRYCDPNLQLLKMEIYSGHIPSWLTEEDRKGLSAKRRRRIIAESDKEGIRGISGRDSIGIFNEFYTTYARQDKLITMSVLVEFFTKRKQDLLRSIPSGFIESLVRMYNYTVLQEVKESLFYYNEHQIARDIQNYLFAINFEPLADETCTFTGDTIRISEEYFEGMERWLLWPHVGAKERMEFRADTQRQYTSVTLTHEMMLEGKPLTKTELFRSLRERFVRNIKEQALDPFLDNVNFRRAIKDFGSDDFKTYDKRIRRDVHYLMRNLQKKFGYTEQGAKEVCIYVIDNDLARTFG